MQTDIRRVLTTGRCLRGAPPAGNCARPVELRAVATRNQLATIGNMRIALTRPVSRAIDRCELEYLDREPIDYEKATAQHDAYEAALEQLGLTVVRLEAEDDMPDAVFVEDPAIVLDEVAVMTRPARESRRREVASLATALERYRPLLWIKEPGTLEGGDVVRIDRTLYVGLSARTNATGIAQLASELKPWGYTVQPVEVRGSLHLKSACCYLGRDALIGNPDWFDAAAFRGLRIMEVARDEPRAANVLVCGDTVCIPGCFPATAAVLEREGWRSFRLETSELMKAEAGVTCMSLIFEGIALPPQKQAGSC